MDVARWRMERRNVAVRQPEKTQQQSSYLEEEDEIPGAYAISLRERGRSTVLEIEELVDEEFVIEERQEISSRSSLPPEVEPEQTGTHKQRKRFVFCTIFVCMLVTAVVVGLSLVGRNGRDDTNVDQLQKCLMDELFVSTQLIEMQRILLENSVPADAMLIPGSYQRAALCWLSELDGFFESSFFDDESQENMLQVKQRFALACIYYQWLPLLGSVQNDAGLPASNWLSEVHVCEWDFVSCKDPDNRVTEISLKKISLKGLIPSDLGRLSDLVHLRLSDCDLSGTMPPELFTLTNLEELDLSVNFLSGVIPREISELGQLQNLVLSSNRFSGQIPASVFDMPNLKNLNLGDNAIGGSLPVALGNATSLTELNLGGNSILSGSISDISRLTNLEALELHTTSFNGTFSDIAMLTHLELLNLANAVDISGTFPSRLPPNLKTLLVSNALLTGTIPTSIGLLTSLEQLSLTDIKLSGSLPTELGNLSSLTHLELLRLSDITGTFPTELGLLSKLNHLGLPERSGIVGTVPSEICNLMVLPRSSLQQICGPSHPQCDCCTTFQCGG